MAFRKVNFSTIDTSATTVTDPIIILANNNASDSTDLGWLGKYSTNSYAGLFRDSTNKQFYLVEKYTTFSDPVDVDPSAVTRGTLNVSTLDSFNLDVSSLASVGSLEIATFGTLGSETGSQINLSTDGFTSSRSNGILIDSVSGPVEITGYSNGTKVGANWLPLNDGLPGQALVTLGNGQLAWANVNDIQVASANKSWLDYSMDYASDPVQVGTTAEGEVWEYYYDNSTAYRLIPTDGVSRDSFYSTWDGTDLSGFIVRKGGSM